MLWMALVILAAISGITAASTACGVNMIFTMRIARERSSTGRAQGAYFIGSVLGAAVVGSMLGAIGAIAAMVVRGDEWPVLAPLVLLIGAIVLGGRELGALRFALPQRRSQVNSDALAHGHIGRQMFSFGFWLGTGFLTYSPYGGLHLLALACVLSGSIGGGILLFGAFGLARALTVIAAAQLSPDWERVAEIGDRVASAANQARLANALAIALVVVGAGLALVGLG